MIEIPVIDLFAGPGGLAEGFSSVIENNKRIFKIKLSVEKDQDAHKTLELRSFCRQFPPGNLPPEYYSMLMETDLDQREKKKQLLFRQFDKEYKAAKEEAWLAELGNEQFPSEMIDQRIQSALKDEKNWLLIGGPPCQAYSLAGRSRVGGVHEDDHRVYLYKEYLRIIAVHQPAVFVMENVKGLLSATLNEEKIFNWILRDLKNPSSVFPGSNSVGYRIYSFVKNIVTDDKDYLIKTEDYGIPQKRHRVIILGIREDINSVPGTLEKMEKVALKTIIGRLPKLRSGLYRKFAGAEFLNGEKKRHYQSLTDSPSLWEQYINGFKKEILTWNGLDNYRDKQYVKAPLLETGAEFVLADDTIAPSHPLRNWYLDPKLNGVPNHQSRSHLVEDLKRYLFAGIFTESKGKFPRMDDYEKFSENLLPDHDNVKSGKFSDRFRVQLPDEPATTVTSHISKDGHYFIHYDPNQCRSLTVREAARIQTFPDNYLFCGSRTQQYHQVGNAVPPYLAKQIAVIVKDIFKKRIMHNN